MVMRQIEPVNLHENEFVYICEPRVQLQNQMDSFNLTLTS